MGKLHPLRHRLPAPPPMTVGSTLPAIASSGIASPPLQPRRGGLVPSPTREGGVKTRTRPEPRRGGMALLSGASAPLLECMAPGYSPAHPTLASEPNANRSSPHTASSTLQRQRIISERSHFRR